MKNKGFTLVELIVVVAILAIATTLIATNFDTITGKEKDFEYKEIAKDIADAAYVYYDFNGTYPDSLCVNGVDLIKEGYISEDHGLLADYSDEIPYYAALVEIENDEKKVTVFYYFYNKTIQCDSNPENSRRRDCCGLATSIWADRFWRYTYNER